jgi:hypothetical protein
MDAAACSHSYTFFTKPECINLVLNLYPCISALFSDFCYCTLLFNLPAYSLLYHHQQTLPARGDGHHILSA